MQYRLQKYTHKVGHGQTQDYVGPVLTLPQAKLQGWVAIEDALAELDG
jgi:hypothetical protein